MGRVLWRITLVSLVAAVVTAALAASPSPSRACSYLPTADGTRPPERDPFEVAEVVAKGRVVDLERIEALDARVLQVDWVYDGQVLDVLTLQVDRVYKGDIGPRAELYVGATSTCCDMPPFLRPGDDFFVLAYKASRTKASPTVLRLTCQQGSVKRAEQVFGAGYQPSSVNEPQTENVVAVEEGPPDGDPPESAIEPQTAGGDPTPVETAAIVLTVGVGGLLTAWLLVARRTRRRSASVTPSATEDG